MARVDRRAVLAGSVVLASAGLYLVMLLGAWAIEVAPVLFHQARLRRLVQQHPRLDRVTRGLEDEGSRLVAAPSTEAERRRVVAEWGKDKAAVVLETASRYPRTRVHVSGDRAYFLFFDAQDVLREAVCVCR